MRPSRIGQCIRRGIGLGTIALAAAAPASVGAAAPPAICDRACLNSVLDTYMSAVVAHEPASVRWAASPKSTQNAAQVGPGDGFWSTASHIDDYRVYAVDPDARQGVVLSAIDENGVPVLQMTRLRVDADRNVLEAETLIARNGEGQKVQAPPSEDIRADFGATVPQTQRLTRARLVGIVDNYFDAIEQSNGHLVAFAKDGYRIENGIRTCNDPHRLTSLTQDHLFQEISAMTCAEGLSSGIFSYIKSITPRRYPVVDVERGLVLALVRFNHPGNILAPQVHGAHGELLGTADMMKNEWASHPTSALIAELFKVDKAEITRVFAVIVKAPYRIRTGWEE